MRGPVSAGKQPARRLADRGILYAPDFIVNAGGVIWLDLVARQAGTRNEILERVAAIGDRLRRVFDDAQAHDVTPLEAAENLAAERLTGEQLHAFAHAMA